jgi:tRNA modification GTPase
MIAPPDTIAAIATPPGRGGVGIVRVSGQAAAAIAEAVVGGRPVPRVATHAAFRAADGATIDEGLALFFPAPHSYTGESVLELQGHGGPVVLRLLLARCLQLGARLAQPGEFTQRAFLNGKIDLAQAEGVADLIDAATSTAARAAVRSLAGEFSQAVHALVDRVVELRMFTEATLDFPEEDLDFLEAADARGKLAAARADLDALLAKARQGVLLRDGLAVVLIGQPNVGKSSLLNRLAGDDVAIVTAIAGTTRDTVASQIEIHGVPLTVIDTAGLRPTDDPIETLGIERTWEAVRRADLAVVVVDARDAGAALAPADAAIVRQLPAALPCIVVHNKVDLVDDPAAALGVSRDDPVAPGEDVGKVASHLWLSAKTGAGLDVLRQQVLTVVGAAETMEGVFLARERHLEALRAARTHVEAAARHLDTAPPPLELFAEELREVQAALGAITGAFSADDLLGVIFSRFCIGK